MEYDGTQWKVFARPYKDQFNDNSDPVGLQVTNIEEAKTYEFNTSTENWDNKTDDDMGNDAFHAVDYADGEWKIKNVPGVLADYAKSWL